MSDDDDDYEQSHLEVAMIAVCNLADELRKHKKVHPDLDMDLVLLNIREYLWDFHTWDRLEDQLV